MLGRLEKVDLRTIWESEPADFTAWLAKKENLDLLSEAVGLSLDFEAQEKNVGPFKADILCKNTDDGSWVLIENQLGRTDHTHLGQILTYAAGLQAFTIVWITERFTDEHRATLDWLNEITDEKISFFGLEVELWKIGDSVPAPKFNVVSKPNDWSKRVTEAAQNLAYQDLSETKNLQLEYWRSLREKLLTRKSIVKPQKPLPQHWTNFTIGKSNIFLSATTNTRDNFIAVNLNLTDAEAKSEFKFLENMKNEIERSIGEKLLWDELPEGKHCRIWLKRTDEEISNRENWEKQHDWLIKFLEKFHNTFSPIVKKIR